MRTHRLLIALLCFFLCFGSLAFCQGNTAVGDLNGDGKPDLVEANGKLNNVGVYLNDGSGGLGPGKFLAVSHPANSVQLADFNSDGHLDILVLEQAPAGTSPLEILFGDGTGNFSAPVTVPLTSSLSTAPSSAVVADFDGDGKSDIAFDLNTGSGNPGSLVIPSVGVLLGDGKGGFSAPIVSPIAYDGTFVFQLIVVDANKDGKPDLVVNTQIPNPAAHNSYLAINNGAGAFTSLQLASGPFFGNVTGVGDFNGDGNMDFFAGSIVFGDGQGGILFTTPVPLGSLGSAAVDLDHNNTEDLLLNSFSYFPGNGHGGFGDLINFVPPPSTPPNVIAISDFNGDGRPDLVLQNNGSTDVSVFLNNIVAPVSISASTGTGFAASAITTSVGLPVTLIATVSSSGGTPTGSATFKDGTTTLGSAPANIYGVAALTTTFSSGGLHNNLTASFSGNLNASTNTVFGNSDTSSSPASISANNTPPTASAPTVTLSASPNPAFELNQVTLTAKVNSASGTPTGNVAFMADGNVLGIEPLGSAILVSFPTTGLHNLQAVYCGDGTFPSATSATLVEDVRAFNTLRSASTTQVTATPGPNGGIDLNSQVSGGTAQPTGNVVFRANGGFVAFFQPGHQLFFNIGSGTYQISATYLGDAALAPSNASTTVVVGNPGGDFSLSSSPQSVTVKQGQSASFTVTLSPQGGFSSATTFSCNGAPAGSACSFSPPTVTPGGLPVSTTVTLTTTAPAAAAWLPDSGSGLPSTLSTITIVLLWMTLFWRLKRVQKLARLSSGLALLILIGCGGASSRQPVGTPLGTFQVSVTATSSVTHTLPITVTVTQ